MFECALKPSRPVAASSLSSRFPSRQSLDCDSRHFSIFFKKATAFLHSHGFDFILSIFAPKAHH